MLPKYSKNNQGFPIVSYGSLTGSVRNRVLSCPPPRQKHTYPLGNVKNGGQDAFDVPTKSSGLTQIVIAILLVKS